MSERRKLPELIALLYGRTAQASAESGEWARSPRLRAWAAAFEAWLDGRGRNGKHSIRRGGRLAWRRLLHQQPKPPWEFTPADIARHTDWMQAEGYASTSIISALAYLGLFYRWCAEREVDPACGPAFNPAAAVPRPKWRPKTAGEVWSRGEVQALLDTLRRDPSPLARRDLALFLARLRVGAPLKRLLGLKWGQIEAREDGARVRWREEAEAAPLPAEVYEAIVAWLAHGERLAGMEPGSYVFVPLAKANGSTVSRLTETQQWAGVWAEGRPLCAGHVWWMLHTYGRQANIPAGKLNQMALRRTAARLKLDEGASLAEMQSFLDSQSRPRLTKARLQRLPGLPAEGEPGASAQSATPGTPRLDRNAVLTADNSKHGCYARSQPPEQVQALLAQDLHGLGAEMEGLRWLERELARRQASATHPEALQLDQAYMTAAARMARLIEASRQLAKDNPKSEWAEGMLKMLDDLAEITGQPSSSEELRRRAMTFEPEDEPSTPHLAEEIAVARCILRRTLARAQETQDHRELCGLVEIYSSVCCKLVRLLQVQGGSADRLAALMESVFNQALDEVMVEMNIHL